MKHTYQGFPLWVKNGDTIIIPTRTHVIVGFTGMNFPWEKDSDKELPLEYKTTVNNILRSTKEKFDAMDKSDRLDKLVVMAYGSDMNDDVKDKAFEFIRKNLSRCKTGKLIIYGYSWGGDTAIELAVKLNYYSYKVDLLITVDAAKGPFSGDKIKDFSIFGKKFRLGFRDWVDRKIPPNVKVNINYYNGNFNTSTIFSKGGPNIRSSLNTELINIPKKTKHRDIDELTQEDSIKHMLNVLNNKKCVFQ